MIKTVLAAVALSAISTAALAQTAPAQVDSAHAGGEAHAAARPTIESSIKDLLANPETHAVMEKHMPGVSQHPALPQFQDMTLAQVAPYSQGAVTPELIATIDADLKALPAPAAHAH
ncbi:hypothetical protein [Brevundimonas sp. NIBR11]|uniref:hypothetical protein n=1 Tax=Brevundimonas sp. NIBR11 TaxID=3015999 RepID=UPI0022F0F0C9|nr:hypothetical protein [Brevundimonas sp. NIBR11]WGM31370.1 hypothetical protein KKHFBJBL_01614 [Brevundimonas sp. NIBR11]